MELSPVSLDTLVADIIGENAALQPPRALIEVAAPYSSGQAAIFVAARIVFVQELPEQNLFRYGVEYISSPKPRTAF